MPALGIHLRRRPFGITEDGGTKRVATLSIAEGDGSSSPNWRPPYHLAILLESAQGSLPILRRPLVLVRGSKRLREQAKTPHDSLQSIW